MCLDNATDKKPIHRRDNHCLLCCPSRQTRISKAEELLCQNIQNLGRLEEKPQLKESRSEAKVEMPLRSGGTENH